MWTNTEMDGEKIENEYKMNENEIERPRNGGISWTEIPRSFIHINGSVSKNEGMISRDGEIFNEQKQQQQQQ